MSGNDVAGGAGRGQGDGDGEVGGGGDGMRGLGVVQMGPGGVVSLPGIRYIDVFLLLHSCAP